MRNVVLFSISLLLLLAAGCKDKNEPEKECRNPYSEDIIGRWKLVEVSVNINYGPQRDTIDYSDENIIYDFQKNNTLVVTDLTPDDEDLFIFEDFQEGEHFYRYSRQDVCLLKTTPGQNLSIGYPEAELRVDNHYFCNVLSDKKTMRIGGMKYTNVIIDENGLAIGSDYVSFSFSLIGLEL